MDVLSAYLILSLLSGSRHTCVSTGCVTDPFALRSCSVTLAYKADLINTVYGLVERKSKYISHFAVFSLNVRNL